MDDHLVTNYVPETKSASEGIKEIFSSRYNKSEYRPLTIASFFIEQQLFGQLTPKRSHQVNILLYLLLLLSIYFIFYEIKLLTNKEQKFVVWATLFLFALHPIHANVVSNIKCRDNLLSAIFLILSCIALLKIARRGLKWHLILSYFILFCFALISKLDAIGLIIYAPFILLLFTTKEFVLKKIKFVQIGVVYFIPLLVILGGRKLLMQKVPVVEQEGLSISIVRFAENPIIANWTIFNRIEAMLSSFILYFKMLIIPKGYYYYFGYNTFNFPVSWPLLLLSLTLLIGFLFLFIRNFKNNKLLCFGIIFLIGNLIYCVNFITPVAGIVAARYAFIASIGFCILFAILLEKIPNKILQTGTLIIILGMYSYFSFNRALDWKNLETLIEADLPFLNQSHEGQRIAANVFLEIADTTLNEEKKQLYLQKAITAFTNANKVYSENYITHIQKGIALFKANDFRGSIESLSKGIKLDTSFNSVIYEILGDAYFLNANYKAAKNTYKSISDKQPNNQEIIHKISSCFYEDGDLTGTLAYNDSIIQQSPELYAPYENLAYFYWLENDSLKASENLYNALKRSLNKSHQTEIANSFKLFKLQNY